DDEERATASLAEAKLLGADHGVEVIGRTVRARAIGEAIVEEAGRSGADLIVLGSAPRWRRQSRFFSPTVEYVLKKAPCEVVGVDALRAMIPWKRGQTRPDKLQQTYLYRVSLAVRLGQRMVLAVYGRPDQAPVTSAQRDQYCGFLVHVLKRLPRVDDVVIWNE